MWQCSAGNLALVRCFGEAGQPREVAEACLAHAVRSKVEAPYARSELLNRRRILMQAWADYLSEGA